MRSLPILAVLFSCFAFAAPVEAATTVAVVDIVRCMEAHAETKNVEDAFRKAQQQAQENAKLNDTRLKELARKLETMTAEDPNRALKQRQYELQLATAEFNAKWDMRQAVQAYTSGLESIYRAVCGQIQAHARQNNIDVVLVRVDTKQRINATDPRDFALKTRLRAVVYAEGRTDITDAIVKILQGK